jgi:flagellar hook-associated protein 3 FlgL
MRVTSEMMATSSVRRLSERLASYERTQTQLSTGRRFQVASEDVGGSIRAQSLRAGMRLREQEARNAADGRSWLDIADNQLQGAVTAVQRLRDLAVRGADVNATAEGGALAAEVDAIADQLLGIANFRYRDRPLFGGQQDGAAVRRPDPEGPNPTFFDADEMAGKIHRRVGEHDLVQVNVTAHDAFGFHRGAGQDLFTQLGELSAALRSGDTEAVGAMLTRLDAAREDLTSALSFVGSQTNWIDSARARSEGALHVMRIELSQIEDVDIAEAVMDLQLQEVAYQATLQAMAKALPPSLVSFLR